MISPLDTLQSDIGIHPDAAEHGVCNHSEASSIASQSGSVGSAMDESVASASVQHVPPRDEHSVRGRPTPSPSVSPTHLEVDECSTQAPGFNEPAMDKCGDDQNVCGISSSEEESDSSMSNEEPSIERESPDSLHHPLPQRPPSPDFEENKADGELASHESGSSYDPSSREASAESDAYEPPEPDASAESDKSVYSPQLNPSSPVSIEEMEKRVSSPEKSHPGEQLTEAPQASAVERRPDSHFEVLGV